MIHELRGTSSIIPCLYPFLQHNFYSYQCRSEVSEIH